jgi:hypothetical protein
LSVGFFHFLRTNSELSQDFRTTLLLGSRQLLARCVPAAHSSSYVVELGEYSKDCLDCLTAALQVFPYTNELRLVWDSSVMFGLSAISRQQSAEKKGTQVFS